MRVLMQYIEIMQRFDCLARHGNSERILFYTGPKRDCGRKTTTTTTTTTTKTKESCVRSKHMKGSKERYLLGQDKTSKFSG